MAGGGGAARWGMGYVHGRARARMVPTRTLTCALPSLPPLPPLPPHARMRAQVKIINPKAVTMGQLYGEADKATQEWKDGVLAVSFRTLAADPSEDRKWLVGADR